MKTRLHTGDVGEAYEQIPEPVECVQTSSSSNSQSAILDQDDSKDLKNIGLTAAHTPVGSFTNLMNLLNCMLGAGILSVPSTYVDCGVIVSNVIMAIVVVITGIATVMTLIVQRNTDSSGMDEIAFRVMGRRWQYCLSAMILIFNISANLAYLIVATDFILSWISLLNFDASKLWIRAGIVCGYALAIPIALSIPKSLKLLGYFSTITILLFIFYICATVTEFIQGPDHKGIQISPTCKMATFDLHIFSSIAVYVLTFALPVCICPVIADYTPDLKKRNTSVALSLGLTWLITVIPSVFEYLEFGADCEGNILNNFSSDDKLIIAVRIAFFLIVSFSYPITHPSIAASWSEVIFKQNSAVDLTGWKRAVVLIISNIFPLLIAMFLPDMKPALEVGGALGGCIGNFTFPGIMWVLTSRQKKTHWTNILSMILAGFGIASAVLATYYAVLDAIDAFKEI